MSRDALPVLLWLRRFAVEAAQRELAAGLRAAAEAQHAQHTARLAIARETAATAQPVAGPVVLELFCRWLPHGQAAAEATDIAREAAEQGAEHSRAALATAHAAAEAVAVMRADRMRAKRVVALRIEQAALDEHAARGRRGAL
jgi:hypothetical protein